MAKHYVRFQPPGLPLLGHTSEGSETSLPPGFVFAYDNAREPMWGDWHYFGPGWQRCRMEVITFTGRREYNPGDWEGIAVQPTAILRRETPREWLLRLRQTSRDRDVREYADRLLRGEA
jgi:hypothetical protein